MKLAVAKETYPGERRVAITPAQVAPLAKLGCEVLVETGAGVEAGFPDAAYLEKGAKVAAARAEVFAADLVLQVRALGANPSRGRDDLKLYRPGQIVAATCDPLGNPEAAREMASAGVSLLALELVPRITRAQAVDVLSSMATIAGYRAVLRGVSELGVMCPMVTYAAGMLRPARVFVVGVGVAGLRAIATAKALGAVVSAHDIRPTSREEAQSVGAKFVELKLEGVDTQDKGGYAKAMDENFYRKQRELIAETCAQHELVITTAAIPGRKSPLLVTADAVSRMAPGSVIVDMGAERGGNCELTQADERVTRNGVVILGPTNLPSEVPHHASQMFGSNLVRLIQMFVKGGKAQLNLEDEVLRDTLAAHNGQVRHPRLRELLKLPAESPSGNADKAAAETSKPAAS